MRWEMAQGWVASEASQGMEAGIVEELMGRASWSMVVPTSPGINYSIVFMSTFLSTDWLAARHFDVFTSYYSEHIRGHVDRWWVGGPYLATLIKGLANIPNRLPRPDGDLECLRKTIIDGQYKRLMFPANLNNNHWIAVHVDVVGKEFCYGNPLPPGITAEANHTSHRGFSYRLRHRSRFGSAHSTSRNGGLAEGTIR